MGIHNNEKLSDSIINKIMLKPDNKQEITVNFTKNHYENALFYLNLRNVDAKREQIEAYSNIYSISLTITKFNNDIINYL